METLVGLVGAVGNPLSRWMPIGIDHGAFERVVLRFQYFHVSVLRDECAAIGATDVEGELLGRSAVACVAVEACAGHCGVDENRLLIEVAQVALVESHLAINFVAGRNKAISQSPLAERIRGDVDREVTILFPLAAALDEDRERQLAALVLFRELVPVVHIEVCVVATCLHLTALRAFHHDVHGLGILAHRTEVEGCDVHGDGCTGIVRKNPWQSVDWRSVGRFVAARGQQSKAKAKDRNKR